MTSASWHVLLVKVLLGGGERGGVDTSPGGAPSIKAERAAP